MNDKKEIINQYLANLGLQVDDLADQLLDTQAPLGRVARLLELDQRRRLAEAQRRIGLQEQLIELDELVERAQHFVVVVAVLACHHALVEVGGRGAARRRRRPAHERRVAFYVLDAAVRLAAVRVYDEREVVGRADRLGLRERVNGEVERRELAQTVAHEPSKAKSLPNISIDIV